MLLQETFREDEGQSYKDTKKGFGWSLILILSNSPNPLSTLSMIVSDECLSQAASVPLFYLHPPHSVHPVGVPALPPRAVSRSSTGRLQPT